MKEKPIYKTWIRTNKIIRFWAVTLVFAVIALLPVGWYIRVFSGIISLPFLYISFIITYSAYQFSGSGGNFQSKIHDLIADRIGIGESGKVLDIGTGSGALVIKLAKQLTDSSFTGIDYWGDEWEYSGSLCRENAACEGVADRIEFIKASASRLPLRDSEFDAVVSCLTFHEVKDERDKIKVLKEAFRVLKEGGEFVFLDLFLDEKIFGKSDELLKEIKSAGISEVKIEKIKDIADLPAVLLNKKVLGNAAVISGRKEPARRPQRG